MSSNKCTLLFQLSVWLLSIGFVAPSYSQTPHSEGALKNFRIWKSNRGGFSTEAALVEAKGDSVVLELKDGQQVTVPLDKLSAADRLYVSELNDKPMPKIPARDTVPASFDVDAMISAWNQPRAPFQIKLHATMQLERTPDVIEYSANGEFLYTVFFKEAKHLMFSAKDGTLVDTIEYGTAPLTATAITPDGKHLVATLGEKGVGVYDVKAKKEVIVHPELKNVNVLQTTTGKFTFILASKPTGEFYRHRLLEKLGLSVPRPEEVPAEELPASRTELVSGAEGNFLIVNWPSAPKISYVFEFEDDGRLKQYIVNETPEERTSSTGIGKRVFHYVAGKKSTCANILEMKSSRFISQDFTGTVTPQLFVSTDDNYSIIYEPDRQRLSVNHLRSGYGRALQLKTEAKAELIRLHWHSSQLAACDATGRVSLFNMIGHRHRCELILNDIRACLESGQDDRLEKLASAVEKDYTFFDEGVPRDTKYRVLTTILKNEGNLHYPNDGINPAWRGWQERNPKSRLTRFVRLFKLVSDAWDTRGEGVVASVAAETLTAFEEKMAEAEPLIESFAEEATIPPSVYPLIFLVAKGQKWDEAKTTLYMERMLKECPENISGHIEYAYSLQPRWGGKIDGPRIYAERIKKEFPGAIGDGTYTAIALALYFCNYYKVFEELGFDREMAQAGVKQLYRNNLNTPFHRQAELLVAVIARNGPEQHRWVTEVKRHGDAWTKGVMRELTFDEIMAQLAPE